MKLRYDLDKLGWFQFEGLVQTLLKASLGMGVEAWGGSGDFGRDAYFEDSLEYPQKGKQEGPFLFQCKFIIEANASGAKPNQYIKNAVGSEANSIKKKLPDKSKPTNENLPLKFWKTIPKHYIFFCNAVIGHDLRDQIKSTIQKVLPDTKVHIHDGKDICVWIDTVPKILKSYPSVLGISDLDELLSSRVNKAILERSKVAIQFARDLVPVFFPTETFNKAQNILKKYHFVILEGAPEMGKTAIGRMISLSFTLEGWEAIECKSPDDLLNTYDEDSNQVFLADDFFGRTEYDPSRVSRWQSDLPIILRKIDKSHILILTSRMHLLNMGKSKLDLGPDQSKFPGFTEVSVDAGDLTSLEKALILYKHSKNANLEISIKEIIKENVSDIIGNKYFTPERIRRLVNEVFSHKNNDLSSAIKSSKLKEYIYESIANPTKAMSLSFKNLPVSHKWLMFSIVEDELDDKYKINKKELSKRYENNCPANYFQKYSEVKDDLSEAFIKKDISWNKDTITWIHPSCQDLVIEEFSSDPILRKHYLSICPIEGVKLATSTGGGKSGGRILPLLKDDEDWKLFLKRAKELFKETTKTIKIIKENYVSFLKVYESSYHYESIKNKYDNFVFKLLDEIFNKYESYADSFSIETFESFYELRKNITEYIPTINPIIVWEKIIQNINDCLKEESLLAYNETLEDLFRFLYIVSTHDPAVLLNLKMKNQLKKVLSKDIPELVELEQQLDKADYDISELEDNFLPFYSDLSSNLEEISLIESLSDFSNTLENCYYEINSLHGSIEEHIEDNKRYSGEEDQDEEYHYSSKGSDSKSTDITEIFNDL